MNTTTIIYPEHLRDSKNIPQSQQTFDFRDGKGSVPAKRHKNPDGSVGGWVDVYGDVRVSGLRDFENSKNSKNPDGSVGGWVDVYGDVRVSGNEQ